MSLALLRFISTCRGYYQITFWKGVRQRWGGDVVIIFNGDVCDIRKKWRCGCYAIYELPVSTLKTNFPKELKETSLKAFRKEFKNPNKQWNMSAFLILVWIVQNDYERILNYKWPNNTSTPKLPVLKRTFLLVKKV